jgi:hypothetical protein
MKEIVFEWNPEKEILNQKKHGISFKEAETVFYDPNALMISDPEHSAEEDRFVILGHSFRLRLLIVCHCYRQKDEVIRIISARKASKKETEQYRRQ